MGLAKEGVHIMVNPAYRKLFGYAANANLTGTSLFDDIAPDERPRLREFARRRSEREPAPAFYETRGIRRDGAVFDMAVAISTYELEGQVHTIAIIRDIAEQRRAEGEQAALLERVRRQSAALLRFSLDPAVTAGDVPSAARGMTEMATQVMGTDRSSIWLVEPGSTTLRCVDRYDRTSDQHTAVMEIDMAEHPAAFANLAMGRTIVLDDVALDPGVSSLLHEEAPSDDIRSALASAVRVGGQVIGAVWIATMGRSKKWQPDEIAFGGALCDHMAQAILNAERERSTRSLHELAGQLMTAEDEERRRIGRDLHDSTGQLLASLEINMAMLGRTAGGLDAPSQALLQECMAQTKQCANSIRTASYLLHPPLLDELGLVSAVRWQLDGFRHRSGIHVEADLPAAFVRLPPEDELSLFRVLQEALTNAHRHAGSTLIRVTLQQLAGEVVLTISDNGKGIPRAALASFREGGSSLGVGLAGMRERLRQLGGQVEIASTPNGTVLRASLPGRRRSPGVLQPAGGAP